MLKLLRFVEGAVVVEVEFSVVVCARCSAAVAACSATARASGAASGVAVEVWVEIDVLPEAIDITPSTVTAAATVPAVISGGAAASGCSLFESELAGVLGGVEGAVVHVLEPRRRFVGGESSVRLVVVDGVLATSARDG